MTRRNMFWGIGLLLLLAGGVCIAQQVYMTRLAHTSFERYYAFRGCVRLIDRTDTYGDCETANGQRIKLVLIADEWYLDGDGPGIW